MSVARPTFTYRPPDTHESGLFKAISKGKFVFVDRGGSVHPVYIDDAVQGILRVYEKGENDKIYIIGGEQPISKKELVSTMANAPNIKLPGISIPR